MKTKTYFNDLKCSNQSEGKVLNYYKHFLLGHVFNVDVVQVWSVTLLSVCFFDIN